MVLQQPAGLQPLRLFPLEDHAVVWLGGSWKPVAPTPLGDRSQMPDQQQPAAACSERSRLSRVASLALWPMWLEGSVAILPALLMFKVHAPLNMGCVQGSSWVLGLSPWASSAEVLVVQSNLNVGWEIWFGCHLQLQLGQFLFFWYRG